MGSLLTREDTIVIASVSCIYGLGSPEDYENMMLPVHVGQTITREQLLEQFVSLLFERLVEDVEVGRVIVASGKCSTRLRSFSFRRSAIERGSRS